MKVFTVINPLFLNALRKIHTRLDGGNITWAITGSCGFALQGIPVDPHDIDIQTDQAGAYEIERRFASYITRPVVFSSTDRIRSFFGALVLGSVKVEIMGNMQHRLDDGSWDDHTEWLRHRYFVEIEKMRIPVLALEYERRAYVKMGRLERAEMLARWLRDHQEGAAV